MNGKTRPRITPGPFRSPPALRPLCPTACFFKISRKKLLPHIRDNQTRLFDGQDAVSARAAQPLPQTGQEKAQQTKFPINGVILLIAVGTKFTMTRGFLTTYQPLPDAKKVLQPRTHSITWERVLPSPS